MQVLLHMPHTSLLVPRWFYKGLVISKEDFRKYNLKMTDLGVEELFKDVKGKRIVSKYSRLFCDVEKFKDNSKEYMYKYGQGVIYTHAYDGTLVHVHEEKYERRVLKYYDKYHKRLSKIAKKMLKKDKCLLILDCHSFSTEMASTHHKGPFKDVCIGIEENFFDEEVLKKVIDAIESEGLTYEINYPYKGSLVPNCFFNEKYDGKVISIMLEINKRVYL